MSILVMLSPRDASLLESPIAGGTSEAAVLARELSSRVLPTGELELSEEELAAVRRLSRRWDHGFQEAFIAIAFRVGFNR